MFNCRYRRMAMNNLCSQDDCEYETLCNNVSSNSANSYNSSCSCGFTEDDDGFPSNPMYAQSYVPMQTMNNTYMPCSGLNKGTIFPELVSAYYPCQSMRQIQYIMDTNTIGEGCNG